MLRLRPLRLRPLQLRPLAWSGVQHGTSGVRSGAWRAQSGVRRGAQDGTSDVRCGAQVQLPEQVQLPAQLSNSTGSPTDEKIVRRARVPCSALSTLGAQATTQGRAGFDV